MPSCAKTAGASAVAVTVTIPMLVVFLSSDDTQLNEWAASVI